MLISMNLHMKSSKVSIKTRSTPASLSFKGQATKHTTAKWCIVICLQVQCQIKEILCCIKFVPIFISFKLKCRCHCIKQTNTSTCAKYIVLLFTDMMLVCKLAPVLQGLPLPCSLTYCSFEKCLSFVSLNEY